GSGSRWREGPTAEDRPPARDRAPRPPLLPRRPGVLAAPAHGRARLRPRPTRRMGRNAVRRLRPRLRGHRGGDDRRPLSALARFRVRAVAARAGGPGRALGAPPP